MKATISKANYQFWPLSKVPFHRLTWEQAGLVVGKGRFALHSWKFY
jgi:hypothetical protein